MTSGPHSDSQVTQWLLGDELDGATERSIETLLLEDRDFQEQVLALEDEIIVAYLKSQLNAHDKELFESQFLIFDYRKRKLQFLSSLVGLAKSEEGKERPPRKVSVFLCGTYEDLADERKSILESLRAMKLEHDSMELFGARADRPLETCLNEVAQCDVVVLIVGYRYGSIAPTVDISFTEAEYREAIRLRKPCLVYLRAATTPLLPRMMETDPTKLSLLNAFRNRLTERHTVAVFTNATDLTVRVTLDLRNLMDTMSSVPAAQINQGSSASDSSEIIRLVESARREGVPDAELTPVLRRAISSYLVSTGRRSPTVYLCNGNDEAELAKAVQARLFTEGISVWQPMPRSNGEAGFAREIAVAFDTAMVAVVLISRQLLHDVWSRREVDLIVARRMSRMTSAAVVPVLVDDVAPPSVLRDVKCVDVRSLNRSEACRRICEMVIARLSELIAWERSAPR